MYAERQSVGVLYTMLSYVVNNYIILSLFLAILIEEASTFRCQ
jgi:hypothetical protein